MKMMKTMQAMRPETAAADRGTEGARPLLRPWSAGGPSGAPGAAAEVTVVIAGGDPVFRMGLAALFEPLPGLSVVAEAATVAEAVAEVERHGPRVVVMDLRPGTGAESGIEGTRRLRRLRPGTAVLVMAGEGDDSLFACLRAGALGYLLRSASGTEVERAVRAVANGELLLGPGPAGRVVARVAGLPAGSAAPVLLGLTRREHEVLDLVARGLDNRTIALELSLSQKTVRNHVSNILMKIGAAGRPEAIVRAREAGLGRAG
ncbi:LuxR C-terminal-related transcriptional regulator [Streptomyces tsukubensis]|uniref:LuxR C-terminal-related transcriptional regulator n=1 Tax=Streptomyces tsukubensis TaxID=83656 RepID=UPI0036867526